MTKPQMIQGQARALMVTCTEVLGSRYAQVNTPAEPQAIAHAVRILDAAKAAAPSNEILASLEIGKGNWPVLLSAMHAVIQALQA